MKEKVLVVGGTGFLGYNLLKKLSLKKYKLYSLSKNLPKKDKKLKNVKYYLHDITKINKLNFLIKNNFKHVINLSGYINHSDKKENILCHFNGTKNLVDIFKKKNIQTFIQIGSSLEYGKKNSPQKETYKCSPRGSYGISKLKASNYIKKIGKDYNFPYIILRPYQVYGPGQKKNRLIPFVIDSCIRNFYFNCTDGNQFRDFLYVDDFISAIKSILLKKEIRKEIFNIGFGKPHLVKKVIKKITMLVGTGNPIFGKIKMRKDEINVLYPSIKKIKNKLHWRPKVSLNKGLLKTIKSYA